MARIFITGSTDGLGAITARALIAQGHTVTLHARNATRATQARQSIPGAADILVGDLSSLHETKALAATANKHGAFDVVVHNAGIGYQQPLRRTEEGLPTVFAVNSLAPYVLTCLMHRPKRLVYLSSGLHYGGDSGVGLSDALWEKRSWSGMQAYSDSKLHNVLLSNAVARLRGDKVVCNAADPGWVRTKMGGMGAPGDAEVGARTQVMLAVGDEDEQEGGRTGSGRYWSGGKPKQPHKDAGDVEKQEEYLKLCESVSGVARPRDR